MEPVFAYSVILLLPSLSLPRRTVLEAMTMKKTYCDVQSEQQAKANARFLGPLLSPPKWMKITTIVGAVAAVIAAITGVIVIILMLKTS